MQGMKGMEGMRDGGSMRPGGSQHAGHPAASGGSKASKPRKTPAMPSMDDSKMPGMSSAPPQARPVEALAQMPGMDHTAMQGASRGSGGKSRMPGPSTSLDGVQTGAQAYALRGGEDMPNVAGTSGHTAPDPLTNDTGVPPGTRVLSYRDLKALNPYPHKHYDRIIEIRLSGNMQRYPWSINGRTFSGAQPIVLRYGERVRFRFINETMMNHPMHIHGTWMLPNAGNGARNPKKHTVNVKPGATVDVDLPADAEGPWAFHCHQLHHMETGMMRKIEVARETAALK